MEITRRSAVSGLVALLGGAGCSSGPAATPPQAFGRKMAWFALKTAATPDVVDFFDLKDPLPESWQKGLEFVYGVQPPPERDRVFIAPPIRGWTFVIGPCASCQSQQTVAVLASTLSNLSSTFQEAQAFATDNDADYRQWMIARKGRLERNFIYMRDPSEPVWANGGERTQIERTLAFFELPKDQWLVKEEDVLTVAGSWSLNPTTLNANSGPAELGTMGHTSIKLA